MQITKRSKISLSQLLSVVNEPSVYVLLDKYDLDSNASSSAIELSEAMQTATELQLTDLINEVASTSQTLRNTVTPRYKYDDRYDEFTKSLMLDGYVIEDKIIKSLDPNYEGSEPIEDLLIQEIINSGLDDNNEISDCIKRSASDFIKSQPDYNGSLTNIRICLETIVREIAIIKGFSNTSSANIWGPALSHLRGNSFITDKEEKTLASVYTFISDGAHIPIGFSQEEFVRLGRNLCASMCYFLIKQYNADNAAI